VGRGGGGGEKLSNWEENLCCRLNISLILEGMYFLYGQLSIKRCTVCLIEAVGSVFSTSIAL